MAVHLHLLVLVFIILVPTPQQARGNVSRFSPMDDLSRPINFNVVEGNYTRFLDDLHGALANNPTRLTVRGVPVLARQRGPDRVPARWILVNLVGTDAVRDKTTIAVRDDNIYIVGFTNSRGSWFVFKNRAHLITGSTVLPFGDCYKDLVGGFGPAYKKLPNIPLGKENMLKAVQKLAHHHPNPDNSYHEKLKKALATLCVMVAEAERFVPIKETVAHDWKGTPHITATEANYVVLWGDISCALLKWKKGWDWEDEGNKLRKKAKIKGPQDALRTLGLVLRKNGCGFDAITAGDGKRPLADDSSTICKCDFL